MSQTQSYSLTRALALVKSLTTRIQTTSDEFRGTKAKPIIGLARGKVSKTPADGRFVDVKAAEDHYRGNMKSYNDMVELRRKLKSAINLANSSTKVTIAGTEMTIADALDLKNEVSLRQQVLASVRTQHLQHANAVESDVTAQETRINEQVKATAGTSSDGAATKDVRDTYVKLDQDRRQLVLLDPNNITEWIEKESKEITSIVDEIDYVLSEINAKTSVNV
jgi:hypothetical protein